MDVHGGERLRDELNECLRRRLESRNNCKLYCSLLSLVETLLAEACYIMSQSNEQTKHNCIE